jgi:HSP20 family protein
MLTKTERRHEIQPRGFDLIDRLFDEWPTVLRRPVMLFPERGVDSLRVEEFTEDGKFVVKAEIPGLDPKKDVEITLQEGILRIRAERREEDKSEAREFVRREIRYGSFERDIALPQAVSESEVDATYENGVLEIRVPLKEVAPKKAIPIHTA